jgi:hypothetical protein
MEKEPRYQVSLYVVRIGSRDLPAPVYLPAIPAQTGEEFLRWLADVLPQYRSTAFHLVARDDRTSRMASGSVGWQLQGKIKIPYE